MNKSQVGRLLKNINDFLRWPGWAGLAVLVAIGIALVGWWFISSSDSDELGGRIGTTTATLPQEQNTLLTRGVDALGKGLYPEALNYFRQALVIAREAGNRADEGTILIRIGDVYHSQGRFD